MKKTVLATHDGGRKWEVIQGGRRNCPGAADRSAFSWIAFANKDYGIVMGFNQPFARWGSPIPGVDGPGRRHDPARDPASVLHRW